MTSETNAVHFEESAEWKVKSGKRGALILKIFLFYGILFNSAIMFFVLNDPAGDKNGKAIILMSFFALWVCWIGICGTFMYKMRDKIKNKLKSVNQRRNWMITFIIFATCLALLEEVFTVTATNLYWVFGGEYGKAYITASDNYFEVVLLHSVIVFWPVYVFWALWLKKYDFHPNWVMILYGLTGLGSEMSYGGIQAIFAMGMWVFVYGLMIYLPAYCIPEDRGAKRPKFYHYLLTLILPVFFQVPVVIGVQIFRGITGHTFPFVAD